MLALLGGSVHIQNGLTADTDMAPADSEQLGQGQTMPNKRNSEHANRDGQKSIEDQMDLEAASMHDKKESPLDCGMRFDNRTFKKLSRAQRNELVEEVLKVMCVDSCKP